ncbi:hypothetical protein CGCTS75_v002281 [Colletotrichum tropicale]|nr:hypothetical protein CGCTS75_v002281 [Colletotrichum tropicale]
MSTDPRPLQSATKTLHLQRPPVPSHEALLKRNDTVLDLLRCIPYIESPGNSLALATFLMQDIPVIDYRNKDLQKKIREDCIEGLVVPITGLDPLLPPSCAIIAICRSRSGYDVILDTADD